MPQWPLASPGKKGPAVLLGTAGLKRAHRNRIWEEYPSNRMRRENNAWTNHLSVRNS